MQQVQVHGTALYSIVCDCTLYNNTHRTARRLGSSPSDQIKCNQQVCLLAPSTIPPFVLNLRLSFAPAPAPACTTLHGHRRFGDPVGNRLYERAAIENNSSDLPQFVLFAVRYQNVFDLLPRLLPSADVHLASP